MGDLDKDGLFLLDPGANPAQNVGSNPEDDADDLDDFDLDLLDDSDDLDDDDAVKIPKKRVSELIKKRVAKERGKNVRLRDEFQRVYGMSPEDAIGFGIQEAQKYHAAPPQYGGQQGQQVVSPAMPQDPVTQKLSELENRVINHETTRMRELEASEFLRHYPNVAFTDIPRDVLNRRAAGGVTLTEAYRLYMADKHVMDAAKHAAQVTAKNIRSRDGIRVEGSDYSGGAGDTAGSLTDDERQFARMYGMSPKEYVAYKTKLQRSRNE